MFLCAGLDDPEKIKSIAGLTDAWLEEATEFSLDDFS
jgi:phage terminase large subunit